MKPQSWVSPALAIAIATGIGCTSKSCPPCEAAKAQAAAAGHHASGKSDSNEYYALPGIDHGLLQSPVNILSHETEHGKHTIVYRGEDEAEVVRNLGTTVQLGFGRGITTEFDGHVYEFMQLHFPTPSEHLIDGITYPMEMHLVHSRPGPSADSPPAYLSISILVRMGEANRFLDEFLDAIPTKKGKSTQIHDVFLHDMFPSGFNFNNIHYYHYKGSLTTPPYTESVDWLVAKEVIEAGPAQIQRINLLEGNNARHVQALYRREIDE